MRISPVLLTLAFFSLICVRAAPLTGGGTAVDEAVLAPGLFQTDVSRWEARNRPLGLRRETGTSLAFHTSATNASLLGLPIANCRWTAAADHISAVEVTIYSRAMNGELAALDMRKMADAWVAALSQHLNATPADDRESARRTSAVPIKRLVWTSQDTTWTLDESSRTSGAERPEFLRLTITAAGAGPATNAASAGKCADRAVLLARVRREPSGAAVIPDIPAASTTANVYSSMATPKRLIEYLGVSVAPGELEQLASTSATGYTRFSDMTESLRRISRKYALRFKVVSELDSSLRQKLTDAYTRVARRRKISAPTSLWGTAIFWTAADVSVAAEAATMTRLDSALLSAARESVDQGVPLLWTCVGPGGQDIGALNPTTGRTRLITGYDIAAGEILFLEPARSGSDPERMKLDAAAAVTLSVYQLAPPH